MKRILIRELARPTTLFRRADGGTGWMPVFIELDPATGTLSAGVCVGADGLQNDDGWHNRRLRFFLRDPLGREQANHVMTEMAPLAQRVLDGYVPARRSYTLSDDAKDALFALNRLAYQVVAKPSAEEELAARAVPGSPVAAAA